MADHELEPLDPELRALLDASARPEPMPGAVRARLTRRLDLSVALAAPGDAPDLGTTPSGAEAAKGAGSAALAKKAWLLAAGTFVLGAGAGAGVTATMMERRSTQAPRAVVHEAPAIPAPALPLPALPPEPPPVDASPAETDSPAPAPARRRAAVEASPAARDALLSEERSLVEMARSALVRGDGAAALEAVQLHARRFPDGRLREERDSLWIQAQLRAGQFAEARERARKFRARYPGSLLWPLVESALSSIPVTESPRAPQSPAGTPPKDVHDEPATDRSPKQ